MDPLTPPVPDWLTAAIMETYYGGRTECHIRRLVMPGVATDITSEYPTSFVNQGLWRFLTADSFTWTDQDPAELAAELDAITLDQVFDAGWWPNLTRLVLIEPDGDFLPTRAVFDGHGGVPNVAMCHRAGGPAQWYALADIVTSVLNTQRVPRILRVLQFTPGSPQAGLKAIALAGRDDFPLDPYTDDLERRAIELRKTLQADEKTADTEEAARALGAQQLAMKITANALYGSTIEMNTAEHQRLQTVTVHLPDNSNYTSLVRRTETTGNYFHPLLATLMTSGGRLMLALIIQLVEDAGGTYVYCDTDSLFIVATETGGLIPCPGGAHRLPDGTPAVLALSWLHVRDIVDRFRSLNTYGPPLAGESILKIEKENFDPATGEQWQIHCLSIASKRYSPLRFDKDGQIHLLDDPGSPGFKKRSDHGLGHLLPPDVDDLTEAAFSDELPDSDDESASQRWKDEWWLALIHDHLGSRYPRPAWFDQPALGRLAVSSRQEETNFKHYNHNRSYPEQVGPFNFAMMAFPKGLQAGVRGALIAPLVKQRRRWSILRWHQRGIPDAPTVKIRTGEIVYPIEGVVTVQTYRDVHDSYGHHPEAKAAGPDGQPCRSDTIGLLQPLTVTARNVLRQGKEANRLADDSEIIDGDDDRPVVYRTRMCLCGTPLSGRARNWCSDACRVRMRRSQRRAAPSE